MFDDHVGVAGPPLAIASSGGVEYGCTIDAIGSPVGLVERRPPLYVPGCALMTPSRLFAELGGFDDRFFTFVEDVDYCWRVLLRGLDVRVARTGPIPHEGGSSTPGGYVSDAGVSSTRLRIALRERNTLTMLLKCYGATLVAVLTPVYVGQSIVTVVLLAAAGKPKTARAILAGLGWNLRQLPRTLALRRGIQASRTVGDRAVVRRMYPGVSKLSLLWRFGMPRVSESGSTPIEADL
jgi:GT2 family glycosyltransferase